MSAAPASFISMIIEKIGIRGILTQAEAAEPSVFVLEDLDSFVTDQNRVFPDRTFFCSALNGFEGIPYNAGKCDESGWDQLPNHGYTLFAGYTNHRKVEWNNQEKGIIPLRCPGTTGLLTVDEAVPLASDATILHSLDVIEDLQMVGCEANNGLSKRKEAAGVDWQIRTDLSHCPVAGCRLYLAKHANSAPIHSPAKRTGHHSVTIRVP